MEIEMDNLNLFSLIENLLDNNGKNVSDIDWVHINIYSWEGDTQSMVRCFSMRFNNRDSENFSDQFENTYIDFGEYSKNSDHLDVMIKLNNCKIIFNQNDRIINLNRKTLRHAMGELINRDWGYIKNSNDISKIQLETRVGKIITSTESELYEDNILKDLYVFDYDQWITLRVYSKNGSGYECNNMGYVEWKEIEN